MKCNKVLFLFIFSISFYACSNKKDTTAELEVKEASILSGANLSGADSVSTAEFLVSSTSTAKLEVEDQSSASTVELGVIEAPIGEWEMLDIITTLEIDCTTGNRWIEGAVELKHEDAVFYFDITLATLSYKFDCQEGEMNYLNLIHKKDDDKMYLEQQVPHSVAHYVIDKPYPIESENLPLTFYIHHDALQHYALHRHYILKINDIALSPEISRENLRAYTSEKDYTVPALNSGRPMTNRPIQKDVSIVFRERFSIKISYSYKRIYY